ncbi:MAG: Maf-like protein [Sphingomonadaceae bacterium]|nr:Maf-like protein [Sphingomonadaceae bacterium]
MTLVLASKSASRAAMLKAASVPFEVQGANMDEDAAKASMAALPLRDLADALAELKAVKVSRSRPGDLVVGSDSVVALEDGTRLDKPGGALAEQLRLLSGRTHKLWSAAVVAENGAPVWRHVEVATLTMRTLSEGFIADYVAREGAFAGECVGGYRIEGPGAQLFTKIEGSHFAIMGLPLLPLLAWLRERGVLAS